MSTKYVYLFSEGKRHHAQPLGRQGRQPREMTSLGMPVPQGFTITTEACTRYYDDGKTIGADIQEQIDAALVKIEEINGKKFGDDKNPLLVSCAPARALLHAGHDGHASSTSASTTKWPLASSPATPIPSLSASSTTPIAASSRCSPTW